MFSEPLVFSPYYRPQVWGGRGLSTRLGRTLPDSGPYGEAWELSSQALHVSEVADGPGQGRRLNDIWKQSRADFAGPLVSPDFPLLVKWLECNELLSLQVHPDDSMARRVRNEPYGKSEAWVVIDAKPAAKVYAGLKPGITRQDVEHHLKAATLL